MTLAKHYSTFFPLRAATIPAAALALVIAAAMSSMAAEGEHQHAKIKVAYIGDSTADGLWGGAQTYIGQQKCLKGVFHFGRFAKNGTGLTRIDKLNWAEETSKIIASYNPNMIIISLGLNDRQPIVEPLASGGRRVTQYESPEWPVRYKHNVVNLLKNAAAAKVPVLLVGLSAMRDEATNRDVQQKNKIFADAVTELAASNVQFIPAWRLKETGEDVFSSYAPGKDGKMVHIRTSDGEHFTSAGDELVAAYLLPKIVATLKAIGTEINTSCVIASG